MNRRWLLLLALVPVAALALGLLARRPHAEAPRPQSVVAAPEIDLPLTLDGGRVEPEHAAVPEGRRVRLVVRNAGGDTAELRLAGYEDRVQMASLAPGETRRLSFLVDRPGDDFAWLVQGRPAGRLSVTGSHLIEGHR
jgi:hypothetical protein